MRIQTLTRSLAASTGLALVLTAQPVSAQLVSAGELFSAQDSAGNPGQLSVDNPDLTTANISVLAPVVVSNWNSFNVPQNTTLNISNASAAAQASLVARVIGGNFSDIGGTINAFDTNLWLVNQNGILFGSNAAVNAASFFASTLDITDADFFDFYEGTNIAGNGTGTVQFQTNPAATTFIGSFGGRFKTDGTLMFVSPALDLSGTFDAGSGAASFVAATDVSVNFSAGSPLSYTVNKGTTVATQAFGGTVAGKEAQFVFRNASTLSNGMLTINANVATTATATERGILLLTSSEAGKDAAVTANGTLTSTGSVSANVAGDLRLNQPVSGSALALTASKALVAGNLSAIAGGVTVQGDSLSAGNVSATGDISYSTPGTASFSSLSSTGGTVAVNGFVPSGLSIAGSVTGRSVYLLTNGTLSVGNVTSTAGDASVNASGAGSITAGNVSAAAGNVTLFSVGPITAGALTATGSILARSGNGGAVSLGNLNAGTTITLDTTGSLGLGSAQAGGTFKVGSLVDPSSVTASGPIVASDVDIDSIGNLSLGNVTATGGNIDLDAGGVLTGGALSATGSISVDVPGAVQLASILANSDGVGTEGVTVGTTTLPSSINITGATSGVSARLATSGAMQLGNVSSTAGAIDLDSTAGTISAGAVSATGGNAMLTAQGAITTTSIGSTLAVDVDSTATGNLNLGNLSAGTGIALDTGGAMSFGSVVAPAAPLTIGASLMPSVITNTGAINAASLTVRTAGGLSLSGANTIGQISDVTAGGPILINTIGNTTVAGTVTGPSNVALTTGGGLTIASTGGVVGGLVTLSAAGNFVNNSGSDAVTASDHWVIYSNAPAGNVFGGLDSGNTALWNATLATRAPGTISGNRYVFAYQPTLTVASTDATKVYGVDLTGVLNDYYTASGLQPGVAGAYQGDTLASILSGTPSITSAGAVASADVAGSPYAMNIAQGSLGVSNGYALVLTSNGTLMVTPKPISATVGANDKTYDGTASATGTVTLSGILAGDSVGTSGTSFTFSDKNVGTDKTVTVSGTMLTGADAGNYTLTVPATTLADIFAKAINASVAVNSKTYDGTTDANGTVTLNGVVAGDSVGTAGTVLAFSDKNAGTGKTVTINGTVLTGADAGNYSLDIPAATLADIFAKAISAAVAANSKTYDGTTAAIGSVMLSGVVAGDSVDTTGTVFAFSDKNVGENKTVSVSGTTLTGADAGNYTLTLPATTLADIFAKAITATVAANNKTYDGTTAATGSVTLNGVVAGDSVGTTDTVFTFSDKNAGTNKTVVVTGTALSGADAGNYTVTFPTSTLASILQRALQITADNQVKFRNNPDPALTYTVGGQGLVAGDTLSGSLARQPGETLGDYVINQGTLSASPNYTVSYAPGTLSIVRDPVADAAAGQNALRALPLPSGASTKGGAILVVYADGLCPPEDKDCRVQK